MTPGAEDGDGSATGSRPPAQRLSTRVLFNRIVVGEEHDPFAVLGLHPVLEGLELRAFVPGAEAVDAVDPASGELIVSLDPLGDGAFAARMPGRMDRFAYHLQCRNAYADWRYDDPYRFGPVLGPLDEHLMSEGTHLELWHKLGAHPVEHEGVAGVQFAVWAPNAQRVSVVSDFNLWDPRRTPMRRRGATGIWEIFVPGVDAGLCYKYAIRGRDGAELPLKADPVGFGSEHPPATASVVRRLEPRAWSDQDWLETRAARQSVRSPISIYEVHLGSWQRVMHESNRPLSYLELARDLVPYVRDMGFTHLELLPISEYPFDGSWGYQPIGLFAPTIRHGTPEEFRSFVEACHAEGIGVLTDWVPGHFPTDAHGLGRFDGTALYEHQDPKEGFHPDWNTLVYNYGRREVANYLVANALYWLKEYHLDGLRVDAVASMLYRDYSRREGEWIPNVHGGRENLEAIAFLQRMNEIVYREVPGIATFAEESTAFPGVSRPTNYGGLGFGFKWNMGWMNDTLDYMKRDPIHRAHHHHQLTFGLHYAFSENFVLPLSHDEVVHGKGSLLGRMPGDHAEKLANLRAYYGFMWGHPGKKLLFMGQEFAQPSEWNHDATIEWHRLEEPGYRGVRRLVTDLNSLYRELPALHVADCEPDGFEWVEANAAQESVYAWIRRAPGHAPVLVVCNFTPVTREHWRVGVPVAGRWRQRLCTAAHGYDGAHDGNPEPVESEAHGHQGMPHSILITLPPLATLYFEPVMP